MSPINYRKIKGTTIEVPAYEKLPSIEGLDKAKLERSRMLIKRLRAKHFGVAK